MSSDLVIKFSYPSKWDKDWGMPMVLVESQNRSGVWGNCKFEINNDVKKCDYWIVYEDIDLYLFDIADCPRQNCILITGEEKSMWDYSSEYLSQFGIIFTSRDDIKHPNVIRGQYVCPWHVKKDYDFLIGNPPGIKLKNLSVICSNATKLVGHRERFAFVNRLKGHFKDRLDWFGRGENPIDDKWDVLSRYKYSVAIENSMHYNYFTEKIADCYLAYTMPFYWGCPNIYDFFPENSLILLDITDYKSSIIAIEQAIEEDLYEKNYLSILKARDLVLNHYSIFPVIHQLIKKITQSNVTNNTGKALIKSKQFYTGTFTAKQELYKIKRIVELKVKGYR